MTINQINKQIETANKNIAKYIKAIQMYKTRANNAIATVNKKYGIKMTFDDIAINVDRFHISATIQMPFDDVIEWSDSYRICSAIEYLIENEQKASKERVRVGELNKTRDALARTIADKEKANAPIESALNNVMSDFRTEWLNRMIKWHEDHFDYMKSIEVSVIERRKKASDDKNATWRNHPMMKSPEYVDAERRFNECGRILSDEVYRASCKEEYIINVRKELDITWKKGIKILADKARNFGIDETSITASEPNVTEKGFETYLKDGKSRTIHARVIWAAEYSEIVTPHTRYVVTEIKN